MLSGAHHFEFSHRNTRRAATPSSASLPGAASVRAFHAVTPGVVLTTLSSVHRGSFRKGPVVWADG